VYCEKTPVKDCFAPLPVIARRIREIQEELLSKQGLDVKHVIMTSDERDPEWWADVKKLGWKTPDHSNTEELYGRWYVLHTFCPKIVLFLIVCLICKQVSSSH